MAEALDDIIVEADEAHGDGRCWVCNGEVGNAHKCVLCQNNVHVICGEPEEGSEEGYGQRINCSRCLNNRKAKATKRPNPWAAFGTGRASSPSGKSNDKRKCTASVKDKPNSDNPGDPHICLKCGGEIARGRDFYKKRHWQQKHRDEKESDYPKYIVPKNHELARNLLKEMASKRALEADETHKSKDHAETNKDSNLSDNTLTNRKPEVPEGSGEVGANPTPVLAVQRSLTNFLIPEEKLSPVEKLQGDISQILVMLQSLTIPEKNSKQKKQVEMTNDAMGILTASNLLEVKHPDICVEILDDGCKVTCYTCQQYQLCQSKPMQRNSWGGGLIYEQQRTEAMMTGGNQHWYTFKNAMIEHIGCSTLRSGGQEHFKATQHILVENKKKKRIMDVNTNLVSAAIQVCKMKSAGMAYETMVGFLSSCGADVGNIGHGRNQFPEIILCAYHYALIQTRNYLKEPLKSTGLRPHISLAVDKSTPHRETNHAILILLPVNGKRIAMPLDAPPVYSLSEDTNDIEGGDGQDLAEQITNVVKEKLDFDENDLHYVRAVHADGQYQSNTFQTGLFASLGKSKASDQFFLTPWDVSHWMDLAMIHLRENVSSLFMKRIIKRANKMHTMFSRGRGHAEYKGLASSLGLNAQETVTFSTTRFFSSSFDQWEKIYVSYKALIESFVKYRENEEDKEEETKYQVRGQDFAIDLCGILDILKPVVYLMERSQAINVPPWKIITWFSQVKEGLEKCEENLREIDAGAAPSKELFPKLSKHWEELVPITNEEDDDDDDDDIQPDPGTFQGMPLLIGWLVVGEESIAGEKNSKKKTIYTWEARTPKECITNLIEFCHNLRVALLDRYNKVIPEPVKKLHKIFELEKAIKYLCNFKIQNGKLVVSREDRIAWEIDGTNEFAEFYNVVCNIPHIQNLADTDHNLSLLSHHSNIVLKKFKTTLQKMVWLDLGNCADKMFVDTNGKIVSEFNESNLVSLSALTEASLDQWFELQFTSGIKVKARLHEENVIASFYGNPCIFKSLGKEMCIALDVALAAGGCEAIVEGFYSVVAAHKKYGGQGNNVLVQRAIVDWSIPDPISCPKTMEEIAHMYTEGDKKRGISKHRLPLFTDERERAARRHDVSKVVDRLRTKTPRCPHVVKADNTDK